jgi:hypothetical protein
MIIFGNISQQNKSIICILYMLFYSNTAGEKPFNLYNSLTNITNIAGYILTVHSTYANILKNIYKKVRKNVGIG